MEQARIQTIPEVGSPNASEPARLLTTVTVRLHPAKRATQQLWQHARSACRLYNEALDEREFVWKTSRKGLSYESQNARLTDWKAREPAYRRLYSLVAQESLRKVAKAFTSFYKNVQRDRRHRPPRSKSSREFFTLKYIQSGFRLDVAADRLSGTLILSAGEGFLSIHLPFTCHRPLPDQKFRSIDVCRDELTGQFVARCVAEHSRPMATPIIRRSLLEAADPGVKTLVTAINERGQVRQYSSASLKRITGYFNDQIDRVKAKRDRCQKGSPRRRRLATTVHKLYAKRTLQVRQQLGMVANDWLDRACCVSIGTSDKQGMVSEDPQKGRGNHAINRAVQNDTPWGKLFALLVYKTARSGQGLFTPNERGSTRTCHRCGFVHQNGLDPSIRVITCPGCGLVIDRDVRGCINIFGKTLHLAGAPPCRRPERPVTTGTSIMFSLSGEPLVTATSLAFQEPSAPWRPFKGMPSTSVEGGGH